jgi:hypothetical protein
MRPHIIHDLDDLSIGHHLAKWRHAALTVDDKIDRMAAGFEILVAGQRRIGAGAFGALALRHVAPLTQRSVDGFAGGLLEFRPHREHGLDAGCGRAALRLGTLGGNRCQNGNGACQIVWDVARVHGHLRTVMCMVRSLWPSSGGARM